MYFVLPALRISSRAGIDSVRGVSIKINKVNMKIIAIRRTGIYPMEIVKIRSKSKSLNGALDILLDVRSGVGDRTIPSNAVESTLRGDCR
jgi:hypothetical protein